MLENFLFFNFDSIEKYIFNYNIKLDWINFKLYNTIINKNKLLNIFNVLKDSALAFTKKYKICLEF